MTAKEFCESVRQACIHFEKQQWNKSGIYKDSPEMNLYVGKDLYDQVQSDANHPLNQLIDDINKG